MHWDDKMNDAQSNFENIYIYETIHYVSFKWWQTEMLHIILLNLYNCRILFLSYF